MPERPNILIVLADQMRADAVGPDTPAIAALAARGLTFDHAFAQSPDPDASLMAALTGWYPHVAGRRSGAQTIHAADPVLPDLLQRAGYAVFWNGPGVIEGRLPQANIDSVLAAPPPEPWCLITVLRGGPGPATRPAAPADGAPGYRARLQTTAGAGDRGEGPAGVDRALARLVAEAEAAAGDNVLVIFAACAGAYAGECGAASTWPSGLDPALLRVPLIVAGPGVYRGATSDALVELTDLCPTVAELAGAELSHVQFGRSLTPHFSGGRHGHKGVVYAEGGFASAERHLLTDPMFDFPAAAALAREHPIYAGRAAALRSRDWTYIHRLYEPSELYDRVNDPAETTNRAGDPLLQQIERDLRDRLFAWLLETADVFSPVAGGIDR